MQGRRQTQGQSQARGWRQMQGQKRGQKKGQMRQQTQRLRQGPGQCQRQKQHQGQRQRARRTRGHGPDTVPDLPSLAPAVPAGRPPPWPVPSGHWRPVPGPAAAPPSAVRAPAPRSRLRRTSVGAGWGRPFSAHSPRLPRRGYRPPGRAADRCRDTACAGLHPASAPARGPAGVAGRFAAAASGPAGVRCGTWGFRRQGPCRGGIS